jgi:5-dehydro-2-deoxygluconokinase
VGRTIFQEPSRAWLAEEIEDRALVQRIRSSFEALIGAWREARERVVKEHAA